MSKFNIGDEVILRRKTMKWFFKHPEVFYPMDSPRSFNGNKQKRLDSAVSVGLQILDLGYSLVTREPLIGTIFKQGCDEDTWGVQFHGWYSFFDEKDLKRVKQ